MAVIMLSMLSIPLRLSLPLVKCVFGPNRMVSFVK